MHLPWDTLEASLQHYRMGPLLYASELELPELAVTIPEPGNALVTIRVGAVPSQIASPLAVSESCEANDQEFLLRLPGVGTYYVLNGTDVTVEPSAGGSTTDLRAYLLGNIFAVLCHQRGLLPLHASAIGTPRGAVAFLGNSGAGKSSLVAFMAQRGHTVVADDICLLDPKAPQNSRILPVAPWLKLWRTTLDALGQSSAGLPRIFAEDDKYRFAMPADSTPRALAEIVLLEWLPKGEHDAPRFERLAPVHALHAVLELTYQSWLVRAIGHTESHFLRCGEALRGVRVYRMRRPRGFEKMARTLDALEAHMVEAILD